ncbi:hypothetical protein E2C01_038487 [Portunus trituberculatus]|uniref:Uncharacterized protein n=1 Tax=Portunus trituberculatus TaxID=210409 RepID=A0A5B7FGY5_PORTR|nr:hypothetical protein [Portunus trituberculatus]
MKYLALFSNKSHPKNKQQSEFTANEHRVGEYLAHLTEEVHWTGCFTVHTGEPLVSLITRAVLLTPEGSRVHLVESSLYLHALWGVCCRRQPSMYTASSGANSSDGNNTNTEHPPDN